MARSFNVKSAAQKNVKAIAAVGGGLLAFAVLGYLLLIAPQRSKASSLQTQIAAAQTQLSSAQAAAHARPAVDPRVDDLFRLTKAMPADTDMAGILLQLSQVANDTGISFDSITPGPATATGNYQEVPIKVSFKGNYYDLSDFLFRLNNLVSERGGKLNVDGRLFSVDGIDFSQAGTAGNTLTASLSANAFIYGTGTSTGSATPATGAAPSTTPGTNTPPATATPTSSAAPAAGSSS